MACVRGPLAAARKAAQEQGAAIGRLSPAAGDPLGRRGLLTNGYSLGSLVGIAGQLGVEAHWWQQSLTDAERAGGLGVGPR
jgi:hypothetical protein